MLGHTPYTAGTYWKKPESTFSGPSIKRAFLRTLLRNLSLLKALTGTFKNPSKKHLLLENLLRTLLRRVLWHDLLGPYPQYGWDFPEEIPEFYLSERPRKRSQSVFFRNFPSRVRLGSPKPYNSRSQALQFKAFEASRAFPEFSPLSTARDASFWLWRGLRAGHRIPSSTEGISELWPHSCHASSNQRTACSNALKEEPLSSPTLEG